MKLLDEINFVHEPVQFRYRGVTAAGSWNIFHTHQGMEFLYIHEGAGSVIFGQRIYPLKSGSLLYFQPFQLHGTKVELEDNTRYVRSMLLFDPAFLEPYLTSLPNFKEFFHFLWKGQLQEQIILQANGDGYLESLFQNQDRIIKQSSVLNQQEDLIVLCISFLQYLKSVWPETVAGGKSERERSSLHAEKIMEWIEAHYMEEFELEKLSSGVHLSGCHLSHLFKQTTGASITDYLNARRMRQACWLLKSSSLTVEHIGQEVGLTNFSYFCQLFKKTIGVTPHKYRVTNF